MLFLTLYPPKAPSFLSGPDIQLLHLVPALYCISTSKLNLFLGYNIVLCHYKVAKTAVSITGHYGKNYPNIFKWTSVSPN